MGFMVSQKILYDVKIAWYTWAENSSYYSGALDIYSPQKQTKLKYNYQTTLLMNEPPAIEIKHYCKC